MTLNICDNANVTKIKNYGGDATFYSLTGENHHTAPAKAYTKETLDWMIN